MKRKGSGREDAEATLRAAGLRATRQRLALYQALAAASEPRSAEALLGRGGGADQATVYRVLDAFERTGIVRRVTAPGSDRALFELSGEHHHHIVCNRCDAIEDIDICVPDSIVKDALAASRKFHRVLAHELEFVGVCSTCVRS